MTSATSLATSVGEAIAGFNSAALAALTALDVADYALMATGGLILVVIAASAAVRGRSARWLGPPRRFESGAEFLFLPMIVYLVALMGLHEVIGRYLPSEQAENATENRVDLAAVLANNAAMVFGAVACWAVGRRCIGTRQQPFVLGTPTAARNVLGGIGGALVAVAVCPATLYATVWIIETLRPDFVFHEHQVIDALRSPGRPTWLPWALWIGVAAVTPVAEELFFRGLVQTTLGQVLRNRWGAIVAAAGLFGLAHASQPQVVPAIFVFGLVLGVLYERRGSLIGPIVAHALFNAKTLLWESLATG